MITLEDIVLENKETIVIAFSYEGENMEFKGNMRIGKENWIESKLCQEDDIDMIKGIVYQELMGWVKD